MSAGRIFSVHIIWQSTELRGGLLTMYFVWT